MLLITINREEPICAVVIIKHTCIPMCEHKLVISTLLCLINYDGHVWVKIYAQSYNLWSFMKYGSGKTWLNIPLLTWTWMCVAWLHLECRSITVITSMSRSVTCPVPLVMTTTTCEVASTPVGPHVPFTVNYNSTEISYPVLSIIHVHTWGLPIIYLLLNLVNTNCTTIDEENRSISDRQIGFPFARHLFKIPECVFDSSAFSNQLHIKGWAGLIPRIDFGM